jgi:hypothetical protein
MPTHTWQCDCGRGTCTYDLEAQGSVVVTMNGKVSLVSWEKARNLLERSRPATGGSVKLPEGMSYDQLLNLIARANTAGGRRGMPEALRSQLQAITKQLIRFGDGVLVTCSCSCQWVVPIERGARR